MNNSIQLLLAKLVTNPRLASEAINKTDQFLTTHNFDKEQKQEITNFFNDYGVKFLASSQLLIKKRFDAIVDALQVGKSIFSYETLHKFFENYLDKIKLDDYVAKNPVEESICFCEFILSYESISEKEKIILDYDLTRNSVLMLVMHDSNSYDHAIKDVQSDDCTPIFHPSIRIKRFPLGTSLLVKNIRSGVPIDIEFSLEEEILLFHKNWKKTGVVTLKISSDTEKFINILMNSSSLHSAYQSMIEETGIDIIILKSLITQFTTNGVCVFRK